MTYFVMHHRELDTVYTHIHFHAHIHGVTTASKNTTPSRYHLFIPTFFPLVCSVLRLLYCWFFFCRSYQLNIRFRWRSVHGYEENKTISSWYQVTEDLYTSDVIYYGYISREESGNVIEIEDGEGNRAHTHTQYTYKKNHISMGKWHFYRNLFISRRHSVCLLPQNTCFCI